MPKKPATLDPVRPNAAVTARYKRALQELVAQMQESVLYWLKGAYKANQPAIAQDDMPYRELQRAVRKLSKRWQRKFDEAAPKLADYFLQSANSRSQAQLKRILKEAGFSVEFKMDRAFRDVMGASVNENVSLIKSIPAKYFTEIEGAVMRSVVAGRDLKSLADDLSRNYGVTQRRAAFIARDQNNKATAALTRARQTQMGVTEAVWVHTAGGKTQRKTHVAASKRGQRYNVTKGWYDPDANGKGKGAWIFPGELINCRCVSRPVIPGF